MNRRFARALSPLPFLIFLVVVYEIFPVSMDDPYITFRYAANLRDGLGAVYNPGERVEGFSSPLHMLLCACLLSVFPALDILFKAKLLGIFFGLLTIFQTGKLAKMCGLRRGGVLMAQTLLALNVNFALSCVNGLETSLYAALILTTARAFLSEVRAGVGVKSGIFLFFCLLTRPDALLFFPVLLLIRRRFGRGVLTFSLAFLIPALVFFLVRHAYFGDWLPNTYYAKDVPLTLIKERAGPYLWRMVTPWLLGKSAKMAFLSVTCGIFWILTFWGARRGGVSVWLCVGLAAAESAFIVKSAGDWMDGWRFMTPILPFLTILQARALQRFGLKTRKTSVIVTKLATTASLTLALAALALGPHLSWSAVNWTTSGREMLRATGPLGRKWVATADYLHQRFGPKTRIAYSEAGYAGWINRDKIFWDTRGITDREIARLPRKFKQQWGVTDFHWNQPGDPLHAILTERKPDVVAVFAYAPNDVPADALHRLMLGAIVSDPADSSQTILPALIYFGSAAQ